MAPHPPFLPLPHDTPEVLSRPNSSPPPGHPIGATDHHLREALQPGLTPRPQAHTHPSMMAVLTRNSQDHMRYRGEGALQIAK